MGYAMRKLLSIVLLTVTLLSCLVLISNVNASIKVSDVITSDTTWTKAESPYIFNGSVLVNNGVTLTIEAGATVNFNDYMLKVNGILNATGTPDNQININGGSHAEIWFNANSPDWNQETNSGNILQYVTLDSTRIQIYGGSPKINNCLFYHSGKYQTSGDGILIENDCHSIITNNTINVGGYAISVHGYAQLPTIKNNNIYGNFYNLELVSSLNLDASYNWWGTTDQEAIARTIYDYKNNFASGTVNFTPFLTELNPSAPYIPTDTPTPYNTLIPTVSPSETPNEVPTATPTETSTVEPIEPGTQSLFSLSSMDLAILTVLVVIAVLLAVLVAVVVFRKRR